MENTYEEKRLSLWFNKAKARAYENKKLCLRHKEVKESRDTWKKKVTQYKKENIELQKENRKLKNENEEFKKNY